MVNGSVANIFNTYFRGDVFDFVSFKNDVKTLRGVFKNYEEALNEVVNNVASITALDEEEYFKLTKIRFEYDYTLELFDTVFEQLDSNLLGASLVISIVSDLSKQLEDINEMLTTIEERLDSGELKNLVVIDLLQTVWAKYDSELALFSYNNLVEQSMNNKPWLVIDTISDFDEVAYISSFQSKPEALRYAMSKGLGFSSVVCRY